MSTFSETVLTAPQTGHKSTYGEIRESAKITRDRSHEEYLSILVSNPSLVINALRGSAELTLLLLDRLEDASRQDAA